MSLSMKEQARLCGVDLDVELELERKWGAGPEETEGESESTAAANNNASRIPTSVVAVAEPPPLVFLRDELELEKLYGKEIVNGDGYFLPRSWVFAQSNEILFAAPEQGDADNESSSSSTTIVHTFARNQDGESICHDKHPFVACVHLLRTASDSSIVHISVPYLSDLHFIDELCHYAKPIEQGGKNLEIRIVLGPEQWVKDRLHNYVNNPIQEAGRQQRESALRRLAIREWGTSRRFSHSKAMVSAAGAIVGSYNYTYAARYYHYEEGVFLSSNHSELEALRNRIEELWRVSRPVVTLARRPPPGYVAPRGDTKRTKIE